MGAIEHLTISLPGVVADQLRARVAAGGYADANEVVVEALLALEQAGDEWQRAEVESWLRSDVVEPLRASEGDPSRLMMADDVRRQLDTARANRAG